MTNQSVFFFIITLYVNPIYPWFKLWSLIPIWISSIEQGFSNVNTNCTV